MIDGRGDAETLATYQGFVESFEDEERAWRLFLDRRFKWSTAADDGSTRMLGHQQSSRRRDRHALPPSVTAGNTVEGAHGQQQEFETIMSRASGSHAAGVENAREVSRADSITAVDDDVQRGIVWVVRKRSIAIIKNAIMKRTNPTAMEASRKARLGTLDNEEQRQQQEMQQPKQRSIFSGYLFGEKIAQQRGAVGDTETTTNADHRHEKRKASRALSGILAEKTQLIVKKFRKKDDEQRTPGENFISGDDSARDLMPDSAAIVPSTRKRHRPSQQRRITGDDNDTPLASSGPSAVEDAIHDDAELTESDYASALEELQPLIPCPAKTRRTAKKTAVVETSTTDPRCREQMPVLHPAQTALTPKNFKFSPAKAALYGRNLVVAVERQAKKGGMDSQRVEQRFDRIFRRLERDDAARQESAQQQYLADVEAEKFQMDQEHQAGMREWDKQGRPVENSWRRGRES
ncbi:hypothetical protein BST61_g5090 [Cercospora zeina]